MLFRLDENLFEDADMKKFKVSYTLGNTPTEKTVSAKNEFDAKQIIKKENKNNSVFIQRAEESDEELTEDLEIDVDPIDNGTSSILTELIKSALDLMQLCNDSLVTLNDACCDNGCEAEINMLAADCSTHVGKLQSLLNETTPDGQSIDTEEIPCVEGQCDIPAANDINAVVVMPSGDGSFDFNGDNW